MSTAARHEDDDPTWRLRAAPAGRDLRVRYDRDADALVVSGFVTEGASVRLDSPDMVAGWLDTNTDEAIRVVEELSRAADTTETVELNATVEGRSSAELARQDAEAAEALAVQTPTSEDDLVAHQAVSAARAVRDQVQNHRGHPVVTALAAWVRRTNAGVLDDTREGVSEHLERETINRQDVRYDYPTHAPVESARRVGMR